MKEWISKAEYLEVIIINVLKKAIKKGTPWSVEDVAKEIVKQYEKGKE